MFMIPYHDKKNIFFYDIIWDKDTSIDMKEWIIKSIEEKSIFSKNNHLITSQIYSFIILPSIKIRLNILPSFFNLSLVLFGSSFQTTL